MSVATIFQVQVVAGVLLFALMATWYWAPRLARLPLKAALTPLLLLGTGPDSSAVVVSPSSSWQ
jgi:hypothetical protein